MYTLSICQDCGCSGVGVGIIRIYKKNWNFFHKCWVETEDPTFADTVGKEFESWAT